MRKLVLAALVAGALLTAAPAGAVLRVGEADLGPGDRRPFLCAGVAPVGAVCLYNPIHVVPGAQ
jgi:hypothetical protein